MIEIKNLVKTYGTGIQALRHVNLQIHRNETLALVGESGCGKSTLAKLLLRMEKATAGEILLDNKNLQEFLQIDVSKHIQMIFQDPASSLNPRKKIFDIVAEPLRIQKRFPEKEIRQKTEEMLNLVGLNQETHQRYPHMFSGGQKQRIGIARALVTEPELIICDEPVSALDPSIQAQVLNLLLDLQLKKKVSYLFISHDLNVVRFIAQKVAVMYLGKIVEVQERKKIFHRPRHPYTRLLLDSTPRLDQEPRETNLNAQELPSASLPPQGCAFHPRCPWAQDICRQKSPELREVEKAFVACHFAEELDLSVAKI